MCISGEFLREKNSFKSFGCHHLFSNWLTGVSYTDRRIYILRGVRYTAESPFSRVRNTAEYILPCVSDTEELILNIPHCINKTQIAPYSILSRFFGFTPHNICNILGICIWLSISLSITACHIYSLNLFIVSFLPSHSPTTPVLRIESRVSTKIHFSIISKIKLFSKFGKFSQNFVFAIFFFFSKKFRIFFIFAQSFAKMFGVFAKNCQKIFRKNTKTKMLVETLIERYWWAGCKQALAACLLKLVQ